MEEELRLYSFVIFYLSPLQHGLQTAHLVGDLSQKCARSKRYNRWAGHDKTIIILNGGNRKDIEDIFNLLWEICPSMDLPFDKFHEDEDSLGGIITCCGVIVPERYFNAVKFDDGYYFNISEIDENSNIHSQYYFPPESPEYKLIDLIKSKRLA